MRRPVYALIQGVEGMETPSHSLYVISVDQFIDRLVNEPTMGDAILASCIDAEPEPTQWPALAKAVGRLNEDGDGPAYWTSRDRVIPENL